jgi:hypothetical protein
VTCQRAVSNLPHPPSAMTGKTTRTEFAPVCRSAVGTVDRRQRCPQLPQLLKMTRCGTHRSAVRGRGISRSPRCVSPSPESWRLQNRSHHPGRRPFTNARRASYTVLQPDQASRRCMASRQRRQRSVTDRSVSAERSACDIRPSSAFSCPSSVQRTCLSGAIHRSTSRRPSDPAVPPGGDSLSRPLISSVLEPMGISTDLRHNRMRERM